MPKNLEYTLYPHHQNAAVKEVVSATEAKSKLQKIRKQLKRKGKSIIIIFFTSHKFI